MSFQNRGPSPARSGAASWTRVRWLPLPALASALLAVSLYAGALDNPFVYDDFRLIVENPAIQNLSGVLTVLARDITRPLVTVSYVADTALWGTRPFGYHLTNILLHALNVVLAFWVAFVAADDWRRRAGDANFSPPPMIVATVTSVLTAAHPVMTQAVGYITARSELLYGAFFLAALLAARQWMRDGGWWRGLTAGFFVLGLLAKEAMVMLPVALWCYDAWIMDGDPAALRRRVRGLYAPMLGAVLLFGAGRLALLAIEYPTGAGFDWRSVPVAIDAFWQYLGLYVWPKGQTISHSIHIGSPLAPRVVAGIVGLALLGLVVWGARRRQGVVSLGLVVAAAMLVPSSVIFVAGVGEPMAEHRAYISAIGFFLACGTYAGIVWNVAASRGRGTLVLMAVGALVFLQLAGRTLVRNAKWGSPVILAKEAVALSPTDWVPRLLLGETLRQSGRCDQAVPEYRMVIAMGAGLEGFTYNKLLQCLVVTGQTAEAEQVRHELERH